MRRLPRGRDACPPPAAPRRVRIVVACRLSFFAAAAGGGGNRAHFGRWLLLQHRPRQEEPAGASGLGPSPHFGGVRAAGKAVPAAVRRVSAVCPPVLLCGPVKRVDSTPGIAAHDRDRQPWARRSLCLGAAAQAAAHSHEGGHARMEDKSPAANNVSLRAECHPFSLPSCLLVRHVCCECTPAKSLEAPPRRNQRHTEQNLSAQRRADRPSVPTLNCTWGSQKQPVQHLANIFSAECCTVALARGISSDIPSLLAATLSPRMCRRVIMAKARPRAYAGSPGAGT